MNIILKNIKKYKPMTEIQERLYITEYVNTKNEKCLEELIMNNSSFIYNIARYYSKYYNIDDLFQVGIIGMIKGIKKFDLNYNTKLITYCVYYIKEEMRTFIYQNCNTVRIPDYIHQRNKITINYNKEINSDFDLIDITNNTDDLLISDDNISNEINKSLELILGTLNDEDKYLIKSYYGIECKRKTKTQLAKENNKTFNQILLIFDKIMDKMKINIEKNNINKDILLLFKK